MSGKVMRKQVKFAKDIKENCSAQVQTSHVAHYLADIINKTNPADRGKGLPRTGMVQD